MTRVLFSRSVPSLSISFILIAPGASASLAAQAEVENQRFVARIRIVSWRGPLLPSATSRPGLFPPVSPPLTRDYI